MSLAEERVEHLRRALRNDVLCKNLLSLAEQQGGGGTMAGPRDAHLYLAERLLSKTLVRKLQDPACIHIEDLLEAWVEHMAGASTDALGAYERFCRSVLARVSAPLLLRRSEPFAALIGWKSGVPDESLIEADDVGFWVDAVAVVSAASDREGLAFGSIMRGLREMQPLATTRVLYVQVSALHMSQHAFQALAARLKRVLPILGSAAENGEVPLGSGELEEDDGTGHRVFWGFARWMLQWYFADHADTYHMPTRVRNAIDLLIAADQSVNPAVSLALTVTAIDALLGERNSKDRVAATTAEDWAAKLATIVAASDADRRDLAERYRELFRARNRALHGVELRSSLDEYELAKMLAGRALVRLWQWSTLTDRLGGPGEQSEAFLAEVRSAFREQRPVIGITYSSDSESEG